MTFEPELPWNSPKFRDRKDNAWTAGCRWLQSWWREQQGHEPGERNDISDTLVGAMLPLDSNAEDNFFSPKVITAIEDRVIYGAEFGIVPVEVLFRNLLETQVLIFNLLGEFHREPNALLPWVRTIDTEATEVTEIRVEWMPDRKRHLGGGPGFDGFVEYCAGASKRFVALECKYAENLDESKMTVHQRLVEATNASPRWRDGASRRLNRPNLRPFWLTPLVAQSLVDKEDYDAGRVVVLACAADCDILLATNFVRAELIDADSWLLSSSYEALVNALGPFHPEWAAWFRNRYLDFTPVFDELSPDDPRRGSAPPSVPSAELRRLLAVGQKVSGNKIGFKRVLKRLDNAATDPAQIAALEARAADLAADLEAFWEALATLDR